MKPLQIPYEVNKPELRDKFIHTIVPSRIDALQENTPPMWGKMSAQHMVEHLIDSFQMSTGKKVIQETPETPKQVKYKSFLDTNIPIYKGVKSPLIGAKPPTLELADLNVAKHKLREEIEYFEEYYRANPGATHFHPIFGVLNAKQWQKFHFKHCFHHLTQFNLISSDTHEK